MTEIQFLLSLLLAGENLAGWENLADLASFSQHSLRLPFGQSFARTLASGFVPGGCAGRAADNHLRTFNLNECQES